MPNVECRMATGSRNRSAAADLSAIARGATAETQRIMLLEEEEDRPQRRRGAEAQRTDVLFFSSVPSFRANHPSASLRLSGKGLFCFFFWRQLSLCVSVSQRQVLLLFTIATRKSKVGNCRSPRSLCLCASAAKPLLFLLNPQSPIANRQSTIGIGRPKRESSLYASGSPPEHAASYIPVSSSSPPFDIRHSAFVIREAPSQLSASREDSSRSGHSRGVWRASGAARNSL